MEDCILVKIIHKIQKRIINIIKNQFQPQEICELRKAIFSVFYNIS
jgi:hypothetical protein